MNEITNTLASTAYAKDNKITLVICGQCSCCKCTEVNNYSDLIEASLNVFSEFTEFRDKNYYVL